MYKERARKKDVNPFALKKGFHIVELHMGDVPGDGYELTSTSDIAGPFKSLERAREVFKKIICGDENRNHWDFDICGPEHRPYDIQLHGMVGRRETDDRRFRYKKH